MAKMPKEIKKTTYGFVIQTWDNFLKKWTDQTFVAGDQCEYENEKGESVDCDDDVWNTPDGAEPYLPFLMRQPDEMK
jgi:hypothetical protein